MFLASLAFAAGIIAPNLAWRAPHVWLTAFLVAAACVCVLYGWPARSPAFPFAAMILPRRRLLLAWLGVVGLSASALYLVFTPPKMQGVRACQESRRSTLRQIDSVSIVTPKGKTVLLDSGGSGAGTFRLRCRRGSCVSLFLEPRYSATPRSRDLPPSLRSRRNAQHHCELQAAGTLVQAGISDSGICGAGGDSAKLRRRLQAAGRRRSLRFWRRTS